MKTYPVRLLSVVFLALVLPASLGASVSVSFSPLIWGGDIQLGYDVGDPALPTTLELGTAAAYSSTPYFRDPDGSLYTGGRQFPETDAVFDPDEAPYFQRRLWRWNTGVRQALVYDRDTGTETAGVFLRYVGIREWHEEDDQTDQLIFESAVPDTDGQPEQEGQLLNTIRVGADVGHVVVAPVTTTRQGWDAQVVGEWGPPFLGNTILGNADFARIGAQARGFLRLYEAEPRGATATRPAAGVNANANATTGAAHRAARSEAPASRAENTDSAGDTTGNAERLNQFALYGGAYITGDFAFGERVPLSARRSILRPLFDRSGLGGTVRGYESGRYDAQAKVAGGGELRAVLPAIARADVLPGVVAYADAGAYRGLADGDREASGVAAGGGAGLSISLFDLATLVFYSQYALADTRVDGSRFTPFAIGFGYHF
ncbi:MAG: hypothetical protein ACLFM0_01895 [Spirochaetales bacterium]